MKIPKVKVVHQFGAAGWLALSLLLLPGVSMAQSERSPAGELRVPEQVVEEVSRECTSGDCVEGYGVLEIKTTLGTNVSRGNFRNGKYDGYGKLTEMVSRSERAYYDGNWSEGLRSGRGTYWNGKGNLYIGEWKNDKRHGKGSYFFGVKDWAENKYSEQWLSENVENYTGDFVDDLYNGQGTYRWPDGQRYVGGFYANDKHGPGTFYYPTGSTRQQVWEYGDFVR